MVDCVAVKFKVDRKGIRSFRSLPNWIRCRREAREIPIDCTNGSLGGAPGFFPMEYPPPEFCGSRTPGCHLRPCLDDLWQIARRQVVFKIPTGDATYEEYDDGRCILFPFTKILSMFPKPTPPLTVCTVAEPHFGHYPFFIFSSFPGWVIRIKGRGCVSLYLRCPGSYSFGPWQPERNRWVPGWAAP
jgi:hypothetical protein